MRRSPHAGAALVAALSGLLLAGCSAVESQTGDTPAEARGLFVGNWELVSFESFAEDGSAVDRNYVGRILYDENGNMSAIGMPRDLPGRARDAAAGEQPRAGFAYFATYEVHPEDGSIVHNVLGSPMNPSWVDTGLVRYYEFADDLLRLSIRNAEGRVTGTLTWRRLE